MIELESTRYYQNRLRVRVCGILIDNQRVLLLKHLGIGTQGELWSPPGGGLEFGEEPKERLRKEFLEETNLEVSVGKFLFINDYSDDRFHAIELFFEVSYLAGEAKLGSDPEVSGDMQILSELRWFTSEEIKAQRPDRFHNAFRFIEDIEELNSLSGYLRYTALSTK